MHDLPDSHSDSSSKVITTGQARQCVRRLVGVPALAVALVLPSALAGVSVAAADNNTANPIPQRDFVHSVWYADNSCRIRINQDEEIGVTSIDADMDEAGARTLIHCDAESGRRLTLMTRGKGLTLGERQSLVQSEEIDTAVDAALAWITRINQPENQEIPDEIMARRFVEKGQVLIRETPGVRTLDAAPHVDTQAFAEVTGVLEPIAGHLHQRGDATSPQPQTRMAKRSGSVMRSVRR